MNTGPVGVAVVGCGFISHPYLDNLTSFPDIRVIACSDLDLERANDVAQRYGVPVAGDLETALSEPDVEMVVNLTVPAAHVEIATAALAAGKHVFGEKPLALDREAGLKLVADAEARGLRIGSAPDTFLGAGLQSAQRAVARGVIGKPVAALTAIQNPGPELWHPNPEFLFQRGAGPLFDIGPYYLTTLAVLFGRATRVAAIASQGRAERVIRSGPRAGQTFPVEVPTHVTALIDYAAGQTASSVFSFDSPLRRAGFVEITGTEATLSVPDPNKFDGRLRLRRTGAQEWEDLSVAGPTAGRGLGVLEMARAVRAGVPHRASGALAMHVVDTMVSIAESAERGEFVPVTSTIGTPPAVLPDDWDPYAATLG